MDGLPLDCRYDLTSRLTMTESGDLYSKAQVGYSKYAKLRQGSDLICDVTDISTVDGIQIERCGYEVRDQKKFWIRCDILADGTYYDSRGLCQPSCMSTLSWQSGGILPISYVFSIFVYIFCLSTCSRVCSAAALPSDTFNHVTNTRSLPLACQGSACQCVPAHISNQLNSNASHQIAVILNITCVNKGLKYVPLFSPPSTQTMDIRFLNLSGNALTGLMSRSFQDLKTLRILDLASNHVSAIEQSALSALENLTHLYLDHNNLNEIDPHIFQHLYRLVHLDLSHNNLSDLPMDLFRHTSGLSTLILHHNRLSSLGFAKSPITPSHLDISYNTNIRIDTDAMSLFVHLENLNMAGTGISDPEAVVSLVSMDTFPRMLSLNLSDNGLTFLNTRQLDILFSKVSSLDLSNNPFRCDCSIISMIQWLNSYVENITRDIGAWILPKCHYPDSMKGVPVADLKFGHLTSTCDLMADCDPLSPTPHTCMNITMNPGDSSQFVLTPTSSLMNTTRFAYGTMTSPYNPMLGWWTALALGGMMVGLIACLIFDKVKQRIAQYRRRRWRRRCRRIWEAAKAAASEEEAVEIDSSFPLQNEQPVFYSNDIQSDVVTDTVKLDPQDLTNNTVVCASEDQLTKLGTTLTTIQVNTDSTTPATYSRQSSRRLSVTWGPTSDITKPSQSTIPNTLLNPSPQTVSEIDDSDPDLSENMPGDTPTDKVPLSKQPENKEPSDESEPMSQLCQRSDNENQTISSSSPDRDDCDQDSASPLLQRLEHVIQSIPVSQVHPDCPLHNQHKLDRLKCLLRLNPDKSLQAILADDSL